MIRIEVNDRSVLDALFTLQRRMGDLSPAMAGIGQELESRIANRFETQADPLGHSWAPLAAATKKSYPSDGHHKILDRYGDMLDSLSAQADRNSVTVGFGVPYAGFHEFGTGRMPRRSMLFADPIAGTLAPDDATAVLDIIAQFLTPPSA